MSKHSVEQIKAESRNLRGTILQELANSEKFFTEDANKLLKFHGMYQQEDREAKKKDRTQDHHQLMIRLRLPGGQISADQYLTMDEIADTYGNGTIRLTTRQTIQFHGILKAEIQETIRAINHALVSTLGACGDIVRNIMACPAPTDDPQRKAVQDYAVSLTHALYPQTKAYHQIWLDNTELIDDSEIEHEPIYGPTYLPRKFKIAIAYPGDNCVDVYTNDLGLVAIFDDNGCLAGFNLLVGGGMGMTHANDSTYARLADEVCFITPEQVIETVAAVVTIHRDFGDRENRKHARIKYVMQERGVEWFREELQRRLSFTFQPLREMPPFKVDDHLGWTELAGDRWSLGLPIENGRIVDRAHARLRSGLRALIEEIQPNIRLTGQQNILLTDIPGELRPRVEALLAEYGIQTVEQISPMRRNAIACVALPTCGLAITEAERVFPQVIDQFETTLDALNIADAGIVARMTGCPNGCARPYVAEIAFVGRSLDKYSVFLGGNPEGTRLARPFLDLIHLRDLVPTLTPVLEHYRDHRREGEPFGDFVIRVGLDPLRALVPVVTPPSKVRAVAEEEA